MMWMYVHGPCWACKRIFSYNADHVPSIRIEGERQPVCANCVVTANVRRKANGLPPIIPHPEAYEPGEV